MRVTLENALSVFIYGLVTCAVHNISCMASNVKNMFKIALESWRCLIFHQFI